MADFSATEAAFTGFRIVRERPRAVAFWALLQILVGFAAAAVLVGSGSLQRIAMLAGTRAQTPPETILAVSGQVLPAYVATLAITVLAQAFFLAAMGRAVFRPEEDRFGYFRIGRDELRQIAVLVLLVFASFAVAFAVSFLLAFSGALVRGGGPPAPGSPVFLLELAAGMLAVLVVAVRLSLAPANAFATGRISLAASWRMTRGRFWPVAGTYLLAAALAGVVSTLGLAIIWAVVAVTGGGLGAVGQLFSPDASSLAVYLTPGRVIDLVLSGVLAALTWPVVTTPAFVIYRRLAAQSETPSPRPWTVS